MNPVIEAADLFCGAGGTSTGMLKAAEDLKTKLSLLAINHWSVAINTHSLNHPGIRHKCESLDTIRPRTVVPGGHLSVLAASPECTHHSNAAGGRPKNDQSRATAWHVSRWTSDLTIDNLFLENVREFKNWGPLYSDHSNGCRGVGTCRKSCHYNKPIPSRKGETFRAFLLSLEAMGYRLEMREQVAAEFGDPTSRTRLIIMGKRGGGKITWPEPTHGPGLKPFRTAREIIDWELKGKSIFNRKRALSKNTLRRIAAGLRKFGGAAAEPFLVMLYGTGESRSIDKPLPTVTANGQGGELALVEPKYYRTGRCKSLDLPLDTVSTKDRFLLVEPVIGRVVAEMDIRLRMLQPHELAAAMSFPKGYKFYGNREDQVKQIGNAVAVELARAHIRSLLS